MMVMEEVERLLDSIDKFGDGVAALAGSFV
jgi:hypothetical protein